MEWTSMLDSMCLLGQECLSHSLLSPATTRCSDVSIKAKTSQKLGGTTQDHSKIES